MADGFVTLNVGLNGEIMDEELVTGFSLAPFNRNRSRVVIGGSGKTELARVLDADPVGTEFGLVVRTIPSGIQNVAIVSTTGDPVSTYGITSGVVDNVETTIVSYVVPALSTYVVSGFVATGDLDAKFHLYVNGSKLLVGRTSVAHLTFDCEHHLANATAGQTIEVKVIHFKTGLTGEFEATIVGSLT